MKNILFVIPARSKSKGIKNKNIIEWKGKPLIMYSYEFLLKQRIDLENICISTDSEEYIDFLIKNGVNKKCLLKRPNCLGEDLVVDYPVILHSWSNREELLKKEFEYIAIIRPTSPIRPDNIILESIDILLSNPELTSLRAMRKVAENPYRVWKFSSQGKYMTPLIDNVIEPGNIPRQKLNKNFYFQSGEIEIVKRSTLQSGSISGSKVGIIEMKDKNVDIDTYDDFKC
tara:strand:+ start:3691 stop:4377 length:687 start_codon:yes stop_codon:yes gene_type:complete